MISSATAKTPAPVTDAFQSVIQEAVERAVRHVLTINDATNRRLLAVDEAATYLSLSKREIYNMLANKELSAVVHGRRKLLDIRDLDEWIGQNKI